MSADGFHDDFLRVYDRDARGEVVHETAFGVDNSRVLSFSLFHRHDVVRDSWGNVTSEAFFDMDGNPAPDESGAARCDYTYNEHGALISDHACRLGSCHDSVRVQ